MTMISVIVPIYNSEKYLKDCIESILQQSFEDFELLLINDGSYDSCPIICDEYAKKDKRILVVHNVNGGVSSARNTGLGVAKGKYILFIDSDDTVENTILEKLYANVYLSDPDFSFCGYKVMNNFYLKTESENIKGIIYSGKISDFFEANIKKIKIGFIFASWGKLYKNDIIKSNDIKFPLNMNFGEDADFNLNYLRYCKTITSFEDCLYTYHAYSGSLSNKCYMEKMDVNLYLYKKFRCLIEEIGISNLIQFDEFIDELIYNTLCGISSSFYYGKYAVSKEVREAFFIKVIQKKRVEQAFINYSKSSTQARYLKSLIINKKVRSIDRFFKIKEYLKSYRVLFKLKNIMQISTRS